jgi:hypothetical protein
VSCEHGVRCFEVWQAFPCLSPAHALALYYFPAIASLWTKGRAEAQKNRKNLRLAINISLPEKTRTARKEVRIFDLQARAKGLERIRFDPAQKDSP